VEQDVLGFQQLNVALAGQYAGPKRAGVDRPRIRARLVARWAHPLLRVAQLAARGAPGRIGRLPRDTPGYAVQFFRTGLRHAPVQYPRANARIL